MLLTKEQRQLLAAYPASMISDTVIDADHGISRIKAGQCGGTRLSGPVRAFNTESKGITSGWLGEPPTAIVTWTQLKNWAQSVPADLRERIKQNRTAQQAENARAYKWCHCPNPEECLRRNEGDPLYGNRHHPSEEEYRAHLEVVFDLRDQEEALLDEALGLVGEPAGQMDLFDLMEGTV